MPTHRRARTYADLLPFEVSQLASVLCHGPPVGTPRDSAVWTTYVSHTTERIALLGPKLRATASLPSFVPWPINHGLCTPHRRLNAKPLEDMFAALKYEVECRARRVWEPVALAGGLSASQTEQLALMDEVQSLWLPPSVFIEKFDRLPTPKYGYQSDGCVACIMARMGGSMEVAMALGALLLGSMRRPDMLSTRVCFCREWVRYTIEGDVDCVDAALAEMGKMGTRFRQARRWARQRSEATGEHQERSLGLGGTPYVQPTRISSRQKAATVEEQDPAGTAVSLSHAQGHQGQQACPLQQQASSSERYSLNRPSPEPLVLVLPREQYSPEQYYSANSQASTPLPSSPTSHYSEYATNPFLDGSCSPSPVDNIRGPPDLPFRLFERRRVNGHSSPPKDAIQWPNSTSRATPVSKQPTADKFNDGLSPVPILAKLENERGVGALWKRRVERAMVEGRRSIR
ncbi:hypothetical protein E4T43_02347 [Aureobasidium subglaciale]|nr:hypothetical protein E4T43_02347 [Aureobasidium subglaciale]